MRTVTLCSGRQEITQLTFDLPRYAAFGRSDFLVSDSNAAALAWIDRWPDWPTGALVLHGPSGCGKTHLAHLWCKRAPAVLVAGAALDEDHLARLVAERPRHIAVDDADRAAERVLLHLYNCCLEGSGSLLITAGCPPGSWSLRLPDLASRLRAAFAVGIGPPDDALLSAVLVKHFSDRQLLVSSEVVAHLTKRMERSFAAAADIAARLDAAALRNKSAVTLALARTILAQRRDQSFPPGSDAGVT